MASTMQVKFLNLAVTVKCLNLPATSKYCDLYYHTTDYVRNGNKVHSVRLVR